MTLFTILIYFQTKIQPLSSVLLHYLSRMGNKAEKQNQHNVLHKAIQAHSHSVKGYVSQNMQPKVLLQGTATSVLRAL